MGGTLLWSCRDVGTFFLETVVMICVPWDTTMCAGKSQLLQQSSELQSSGGIVIGNNWEWVESQTFANFESCTPTAGIIARHAANTEV